MSTAIAWIGLAFGIWLANVALDDLKFKGGIGDYLIVAAVFGVLDFLLGTLIFAVLAVASLGLGLLFAFVTKVIVFAIILKLTSAVSARLEVKSFGTAIAAGFIISLCNTGADWVAHQLL